MKAIVITRVVTDGNNIGFLQGTDLPMPVATGYDLLVEVKAISVNPVDTKVCEGFNADMLRVLGWDVVDMMKSVGEAITLFALGGGVWYAGVPGRAGSNSGFQLADERITALKPKTPDNTSAAALLLTAITAWEMLFDRLGVEEGGNEDDILLIAGTVDGVGSILTQLASKLTKMTVIDTTSRPQSQKWVHGAGAHHVTDYSKPLTEELVRIGIKKVTHVAGLNNTEQHYSQIIATLAPQGKLALIDDPQSFDACPLKAKSISLHWEFMLTRSMFTIHDIIAWHQLLTRVTRLIDNSTLYTTLGEHLGAITTANVQKAHTQIEAGYSVGKIVLEGF